MNNSDFSPDDLSSNVQIDYQLNRELEDVISELFWGYCDSQTQNLLSSCGWDLTLAPDGLTLIVICPNQHLNQQVVVSMDRLGESLQELSQRAIIVIVDCGFVA